MAHVDLVLNDHQPDGLEWTLVEFTTLNQEIAANEPPGTKLHQYMLDKSQIKVIKGNREFQGRCEKLVNPFLVTRMIDFSKCEVMGVITEKLVFDRNPIYNFDD